MLWPIGFHFKISFTPTVNTSCTPGNQYQLAHRPALIFDRALSYRQFGRTFPGTITLPFLFGLARATTMCEHGASVHDHSAQQQQQNSTIRKKMLPSGRTDTTHHGDERVRIRIRATTSEQLGVCNQTEKRQKSNGNRRCR